jgi:ubiquinone/menaquinone biosynthesis C-methylase UbiE
MALSKKLMRLYFNFIYNPLYDLAVAPISPYQRFQEECIGKLQYRSGDSILCVGVGTGNEIPRIIKRNRDLHIVGLDASPSALLRAHKKAMRHGVKITTVQMDAHKIEFADESFDTVLCVHVMGFLEDDKKATREIMRVLKREGQFVITYPSGSGSVKLAGEIARSIWHDLRSGLCFKAAKQFFGTLLGSLAYAPGASWVKPRQGFYSRNSLKDLLDNAGNVDYHIDEDEAYQDFIVYGKK